MKKNAKWAIIVGIVMSLAGCGGDTVAVSASAASQDCVYCHGWNGKKLSAVTLDPITDDWTKSSHNIANAAGCRDCHGMVHNHPGNCANCHHAGQTSSCSQCHGGSSQTAFQPAMDRFVNPDKTGRCFDCHVSRSMLKPNHFYNVTSAASTRPAMFAAGDYRKSCTSCHDPHKGDKGVTPEHREWAESGHGTVNAKAWTYYDFKARTDGCLRCHTATGFISYVESGYSLPVAPRAATADKTKEVLTCKACHTSYDFKKSVRASPQHTAPYNGNTDPRTFPDTGRTNLCIPCHAGLNNGKIVELTTADLTKTNFAPFNSHYMAAAGTMYVKAGFTGFTSASAATGTSTLTYGLSLTADSDGGKISSTHRKLGTSAIVGLYGITANDGIDTGGPCVTCHLKGGHTLEVNADTFNRVCIKCHSSEGSTTLTASNFKTAFLEPQAEAFENALALAINILKNKYGIGYNPAVYPYFFDLTIDATGRTALKDWTRGNTVTKPKKLLGACFNINLLKHEPAAFAHARTYTRRLIYDSIDFLDDGQMNRSTGTTAVNSDLRHDGVPVFGKGTQAYTDGTLITLSPGTTEGMIYLIGWSRGSGKWNDPERP